MITVNKTADMISFLCLLACFVALAFCGPLAGLGWITGWWHPETAVLGVVIFSLVVGAPGMLATFIWSTTMR